MEFTYTPCIIMPHPFTLDNRGCVAFARGPFIYCAETVDNPTIPDLRATRIHTDRPVMEEIDNTGFVNWGLRPVVLKTAATVLETSGKAGREETMALIPICLWANRGKSDLRVWLPRYLPNV